MKRNYLFIGLLFVVAATTIVASQIIGAPVKADQRTVSQLQRIDDAIKAQYQGKGQVPGRLADVDGLQGDTGEIEYRVTGTNTYELCANFLVDQSKDSEAYERDLGNNVYSSANHAKGRQCYQGEVN